jgi:hypothetical protein
MSLSIPGRNVVRGLAALGLTILAPVLAPTVEAQTVSCPTNGPVFIDGTGGTCAPNFQWPPGLCNCDTSLFHMACSSGAGGVGSGCLVHCEAEETEQACVPMEKTGTPPPPPPGVPAAPPPPSCAGLPVSVTTGEVFFTQTDARVGEIELTRTYNSARVTYATDSESWAMDGTCPPRPD